MSDILIRAQFSAEIKMHRERLGLTQAEAATLCQVSPRVWWQWEYGKSTTYPTMVGVLEILKKEKVKK